MGYTTTVAYDSSEAPYGLSNNTSSTPNLATLVYNARAQLDTINMQTSTGSALAAEQFSYDAKLRVTNMTTSWQSGSGTTGTIFSESSSYDNASNVISLSTTQAAVPGFSGSGGSYSSSYVSTHLGQLWQGPLSGGSTPYQYLYCSSQPHQLSGLYPLGATCSTQSGAVYSSSALCSPTLRPGWMPWRWREQCRRCWRRWRSNSLTFLAEIFSATGGIFPFGRI